MLHVTNLHKFGQEGRVIVGNRAQFYWWQLEEHWVVQVQMVFQAGWCYSGGVTLKYPQKMVQVRYHQGANYGAPFLW